MRQNLLQNALGQFITKCGSLLQNAALLQNEIKKLLHFGRLLQNAPLLQNTAQQGTKIKIHKTQNHDIET